MTRDNCLGIADGQCTATDRPEGGSDLHQAGDLEQTPKKAAKQILRHEIEEGLDALECPAVGLFVSGLSADWTSDSACS